MPELFKVQCPSCDGFGDHGIEEESGCRYACYACGMSGVIMVDAAGKAAMAWQRYLEAERDIEIRLHSKALEAQRAAERRPSWPARLYEGELDDIPF